MSELYKFASKHVHNSFENWIAYSEKELWKTSAAIKAFAENCVCCCPSNRKSIGNFTIEKLQTCNVSVVQNAIQYYRSLQFNHTHTHIHPNHIHIAPHHICPKSDAHDRVDNSRTKGSIEKSFASYPFHLLMPLFVYILLQFVRKWAFCKFIKPF